MPLQHTPFFLFPLVRLRNSKVLFARAGMRFTNWLFWACNFGVAINEQSGLPTVGKFHHLHFSRLLSLIISSFDVQLFFAGAQVCDPLIDCVWHVNFGWLSTNNPTRLQGVSSNIYNFFVSYYFFCKSRLPPAEVNFLCDTVFCSQIAHRPFCTNFTSAGWCR